MTIKTKITGELAQLVTCQLDPGQGVYADARKFLWKTANVGIETRLTSPSAAGSEARPKKGFLEAALATATEVGKRALAHQSIAFQWFRPQAGSGLVSFVGASPGQIRIVELDGSTDWLAEKDAFVFAEEGVSFDIAFSGFRAGRKGGEGFLLERFGGTGSLALAGGGSLIELNPASYGGTIHVHSGAVAAFAASVSFNVEMVGGLNAQTAMTAIFGGEGLYLVTLSGDGPVLLQATTYRALTVEDANDDQSGRSGPGGGLLGRL